MRLASTTTPAHWLVGGLLGIWAALQIYILLYFEGTYDAGDSVMHYLFARYTPDHPENLLNHWAKPFFTLLATPFAQAGFKGIALMQCLLSLTSTWLAYRYAHKSGFRWAPLAPILLWMAPEYFLAQFSGLTEPLFGTLLIAGALLCLNRYHLVAAILLSFLPFVRTEGFLILPIYALFFLTRRDWKSILSLGTGLIIYSIIGAFHHGDLFWVFTQNPYDQDLQNYGQGTWSHYFDQYLYIVGIPIYALTILGLLFAALKPIPPLKTRIPSPPVNATFHWTIILPFLTYFAAHVIFWATGTGHSLGMQRVMIAIVPLGALIALLGVETLTNFIPATFAQVRLGLTILIAAYTIYFPFSPNPAALKLPQELQPTTDQQLIQQAAAWLQTQPQLHDKIHAAHPSFPLFANIDPFDNQHYGPLTVLAEEVFSGHLFVWDSHFAPTEDGVPPHFWTDNADRFELLWKQTNTTGKVSTEVAIYRRKPRPQSQPLRPGEGAGLPAPKSDSP